MSVRRLQRQALAVLKRGCATRAVTTLSRDEREFKNFVADFAAKEISPKVKEMDEAGKFDQNLVKNLFDNGLMGLEIPKKYGGMELGFFLTVLAVEEISKVDPSLAVLMDIQNTLVNALIMKIGNEEQKDFYLPKLAKYMVGSFGLTEETSGSDAFALKTTADKVGTSYVLNGSKMWITNSDLSSVFLVMANVDKSKGYKGITCFIVDRNAKGFSVGKPEKKMSLKASGTCSLHFDNVEVREDRVLGEIGQGYRYTIGFLNEGRIGVAAQMLGLAQGCFDATIPYLLDRKQFGSPVYDFQGMQHQIAEAATRLEAGRLLVYNAARLVEEKKDFIKESSMAKHYCSQLAGYVTRKCIDWCGGVGISTDLPQEKFFRDAKVGTIYEGTTNIQLSTIAKHVRKLYAKSDE
uniref:Short/branched chain specific acyl-CoA dehydrogenase, mitochondrial n=1 Tax=Lygus hesperus TaxID=30085 RepID=A0A146L864_LYGHE